MQTLRHDIVSDDSEALILVDSDDNELGALDKSACHDGEGILHRAFSLFIFNDSDELLLQKRAADKRLWPDFWSNSCCSHPRQGEDMAEAVQRRCEQELGFSTDLAFVYKFEYTAPFADHGTEHELCSVYVGKHTGELDVNASEVSAIQWLSIDRVDAELSSQPTLYTPWFQLEWARLRGEFADVLPV
ncbi:MAG: isopentenyl-diphosphate Delta-isomerase [Pseudomonadales bacterium]|nr:isopentenyl-diphosphate Delta-isomerase [Pseudomonadales bacterium]